MSLEQITREEATKLQLRLAKSDTIANMSYSLIAGTLLDLLSGLTLAGTITNRINGQIASALTGRPYGWWREKWYSFCHTTKESTNTRIYFTDLAASNTFNTPLYTGIVAIATYISEGEINTRSVLRALVCATVTSPLVAP